MSNAKWDDASVKDLTFAVLMSANDGYIKPNWEKVEELMKDWGHDFTKSAMSQHWSKKVLKEFRQRHPDGDGASSPATPASKPGGGSSAARVPKTPASRKGKGKGKKRAAEAEVDADDEQSEPIIKAETPRAAKKVKQEVKKEDVSSANY
ncbi:hypothetical protein VPNG_04731 [Cytospora leucostoma]|uniref:Myb-like domain-containing protein n=1 Tax=Cytospora leucostoma TaxID=1230097 RepID=A0A423XAJ8_9PEZI|nr:hypothetical protein VPNG_04731 [Cytospora leucostoma]